MSDQQRQLAIDGGEPTFPDGPPKWPADSVDPTSLMTMFEELASDGSWAAYHGAHTERLVDSVRRLTEQPYVRLAASGTIAVELALRGLGVTSDDEVILGGYDFPGNFRAIESVGARPVLVDIDEETGCVGVAQLERGRSNETNAVIISHLHGGLAPMREIMQWAAEHSIKVLEDACQAPGAMVNGSSAGSWGDISVLSFGGSKLLTAGRGGAVACRLPEYEQRMRVWADRGNDAFPLSQLQAAVLAPQFAKLNQLNTQRRHAAMATKSELDSMEALRPIWTQVGNENLPAGYKLGITLSPDHFDQPKTKRWIAAAQAEGIAIDRGFRGFARRSDRRCRKAGGLEVAQRTSEFGVVLHHPILLAGEETIAKLSDALQRVTLAVI